MEKKRFREAIGAIDAALEANAVSPYFGYFNKAVCYEESGEPDEALVWYRKALEQRSGDADALTGAGKCLYRMGVYEQSESCFLGALDADPRSHTACNDLGVLCFIQGRFEDAREWFLKAVAIDPGNADALFNLADTCEELGYPEEARKYRLRSRGL